MPRAWRDLPPLLAMRCYRQLVYLDLTDSSARPFLGGSQSARPCATGALYGRAGVALVKKAALCDNTTLGMLSRGITEDRCFR